jgi:hypothetical protein
MKELAAHLTQEQSSEIVAHALKLNTTAQIIRYLGHKLGEIAPNLAIVDSAT